MLGLMDRDLKKKNTIKNILNKMDKMNKKRISTDNYIYNKHYKICHKNKKYEIKNPLDELTTYQMKTRLVYTNSG